MMKDWRQRGLPYPAARLRDPAGSREAADASCEHRPQNRDDLLAAELAELGHRRLPEADLLTLSPGRRPSGDHPGEGEEQDAEAGPSRCLVLAVDLSSAGSLLWARLTGSGGLEVLVSDATGRDRSVAAFPDYLRHPESLLAVEAGGLRFSADELLSSWAFAGGPGPAAHVAASDGEPLYRLEGRRDGERPPLLPGRPRAGPADLPDMLARPLLDGAWDE